MLLSAAQYRVESSLHLPPVILKTGECCEMAWQRFCRTMISKGRKQKSYSHEPLHLKMYIYCCQDKCILSYFYLLTLIVRLCVLSYFSFPTQSGKLFLNIWVVRNNFPSWFNTFPQFQKQFDWIAKFNKMRPFRPWNFTHYFRCWQSDR